MKKCIKCPETNLSAFYKDKSSPDGYRYVCKACDDKRRLEQARANPERRLLASRKFYNNHIDQERARGRQYAAENPEKAKVRNKKYRVSNPEQVAIVNKKSRQKRFGKVNAKNMKRYTGKLNRTPKWLSDLHFEHIKLFYEAAAHMTTEIGMKFHVDHIVPLQGKNVSGLHVPWNLQVLTRSENSIKGNLCKAL